MGEMGNPNYDYMLASDYSLTEFSNNNFSIIGRLLYFATRYEKDFRSYFTITACKYLEYFVSEIKEFSKIKTLDRSQSTLNKVYEISSSLSFHKIITIFFDEIINKILMSDVLKEKFLKAKNFRNYIAHELCNFHITEAESDSIRNRLQKDVKEECKLMIECILMMERAVCEFNKEPIYFNIEKETNMLCSWVFEVIEEN